MNILLMLAVSASVLYAGYKIYGKYIEHIFNVDGTHKTPAVELENGVDYVPTKKFVVFGHHFASIAGGGPIIGPTVAMVFGYLPVWLWILIGSVFMGGVHDFTSLLASMREKGKSVAEIADKTLGRKGFLIFIGFTIIMLLMVTAVFLNLTTTALSSKYPLSYFGEGRLYINTVMVDGIKYAVIGGIASTSVIIITLFAPLIGYLLYKKKFNTLPVSGFAIGLCLGSIGIGVLYPVVISPTTWMVILSIYTIFAAGLPVWAVLQPRDFVNSFLLYGGVIFMLAGIIALGFGGGTMNIPAVSISFGNQHLGYLWPILFITVACGAISGFHSLVAGGTTSKQVSQEKPDARIIGYGGMMLEALLAVGVIAIIGLGLNYSQYLSIVFPTDPAAKSNPILAFALAMGTVLESGLGIPKLYGAIFGILMVEGFVVTTLDTAVRLNRYLFEELWQMIFKKVPKLLGTYLFNSLLCVVLMFVLAYYNAFKELWQLFGSANQLLAGLALIIVGLWLLKRGKQHLFVVIPGIFMLLTTIAALIIVMLDTYIPKWNIPLIIGDVVLILLALGVIFLSAKEYWKTKTA
ncbi:MAG: carbon starvation protein A [Ignavibacteriaceae bacterium]